MKKKVKYVASIVIFMMGFVCYLYGIMIWQDNNTVYTIRNCTQSQKEIIERETGTGFPTGALIKEIKYQYAWGNDTPKYYQMSVSMTKEAYQEFEAQDKSVTLGLMKPLILAKVKQGNDMRAS